MRSSHALAPHQTLSVGWVDGRNIWLTNYAATRSLIKEAVRMLGADRVILAPSCSFLHVLHDLGLKKKLSPRVKRWLRFATEKLLELTDLVKGEDAVLAENASAVADRAQAETSTNEAVRARMAQLCETDFTRISTYPERAKLQPDRLKLPLLPTTTIGSP